MCIGLLAHMEITGLHAWILGTLVLNPGHDIQVQGNSSEIWVSRPELVQIENLARKTLLHPKAPGSTHVAGLGGNELSTPVLILPGWRRELLKFCEPYIEKAVDTLELGAQSPPQCLELALPWSDELQGKLTIEVTQVEARLQNHGIRVVSSEWQNGKRYLRLAQTLNPQQRKRLLAPIAGVFEIETLPTPSPGNTLIFELTLFEFSQKKAMALGARWPQHFELRSLGGQTLDITHPDWKGSSLTLGADFGESQGIGKIIAQPRIRTLPGHPAVFHSGGELPITERATDFAKTNWKQYGLIVELLPLADQKAGAGEVALDFKVELSEPDPSRALDGMPGMSQRKLQSRFTLRSDETTILTSMWHSRNSENRQGLPWFMRIPILGALFSSSQDDQNQTELWFAIRPTWNEISPRRMRHELGL